MKEDKLLYKELTYKIRGLLFEVHNELGSYCNEKQYGDSFEFKLKKGNYQYIREYVLPVFFDGEHKNRNRVDFIIDNQLVIEFKTVPALSREHYFQCQRYLKSLDLDLALLINFRPKYLMIKRVLNHEKYNKF